MNTGKETTIMIAWPSISSMKLGRLLGQAFMLGPRISVLGVPTRPGWFIALATLPLTAFLYFHKLVPRIPFVVAGWQNRSCRRYRLTNRQILIEHPVDALSPTRNWQATFANLPLKGFDSAELEQLPGHEWYRASDIVFRLEGQEVLRLAAVPHAEAFRQTCLKARQAVLGVAEIASQQAIAS